MRKSTVVAAAGLCLVIASGGSGAQGKENSCLHCHVGLPDTTLVGAKYASWKTSIHAKEGITCDRCHGGNPDAAQEKAAHTDVHNSGNPLSRVYFKKIPATCGACHWRDYNAFRQSAHYDMLEKKGAGPTCVTCHESHSTRIVTPQEIPGTCEECHNAGMHIDPQVPERAQALLLLVDETSILVRLAGDKVQTSGGQAFQESWQRISQAMTTVRDGWHAFNLGEVQARILEIYDRLKAFWAKRRAQNKELSP
jgi:hypothetical protein